MNAVLVSGRALYHSEELAGQMEKLDSMYLPAGPGIEIEALDDSIFYIPAAVYEGIGAAFFRKYQAGLPEGQIRQVHGRGASRREVFFTVNPEVPRIPPDLRLRIRRGRVLDQLAASRSREAPRGGLLLFRYAGAAHGHPLQLPGSRQYSGGVAHIVRNRPRRAHPHRVPPYGSNAGGRQHVPVGHGIPLTRKPAVRPRGAGSFLRGHLRDEIGAGNGHDHRGAAVPVQRSFRAKPPHGALRQSRGERRRNHGEDVRSGKRGSCGVESSRARRAEEAPGDVRVQRPHPPREQHPPRRATRLRSFLFCSAGN